MLPFDISISTKSALSSDDDEGVSIGEEEYNSLDDEVQCEGLLSNTNYMLSIVGIQSKLKEISSSNESI